MFLNINQLFSFTPTVETIPNAPEFPCIEECLSCVAAQSLILKHIEGQGIGYTKGYSTVEAFLAPSCLWENVLPYLDYRGHVFNNGKYAMNVGIGARCLTEAPYIIGANLFYDYRKNKKHAFQQIGLGIEFFTFYLEYRINGYCAVGNTKQMTSSHTKVSTQFSNFNGNNFLMENLTIGTRCFEFSMSGFDAEVGIHLICPTDCFVLYVGIGPYYYKGCFEKGAFGGQARLFSQLTSYISLELSDSYSHHFGNIFQGQIALTFGFGAKLCKKKFSCVDAINFQSHLVQPPHRQEIIVVEKHTKNSYDSESIAVESSLSPFVFLK